MRRGPHRLPDSLAALGVGLTGHRAGVDDRQVGLLAEGHHPPAPLAEHGRDGVGLGLVELASQGAKTHPANGGGIVSNGHYKQ